MTSLSSSKWMMFVMETGCVLCEVGNQCLCIHKINDSLIPSHREDTASIPGQCTCIFTRMFFLRNDKQPKAGISKETEKYVFRTWKIKEILALSFHFIKVSSSLVISDYLTKILYVFLVPLAFDLSLEQQHRPSEEALLRRKIMRSVMRVTCEFWRPC